MKFAIITHTPHKIIDNHIYAYEPYVREMNLWLNYVNEARVLAPLSNKEVRKIDAKYMDSNLTIETIKPINFVSFWSVLKSLFQMPVILYKIYSICRWADHIHLRCPGNIGMLGLFVQIFFPKKKKTIKYAGNWDPKSKQPLSYRIQKKIASNTFLTRNARVLAYGEWQNQTKNIVPFFTASYRSKEFKDVTKPNFKDAINLIFVGSLVKGKQPMVSVKTCELLSKKYPNIKLNIYGDGDLKDEIEKYIDDKNIGKHVILHGNKNKEDIKKAFQNSHFLIFISKSEGWPKVITESMFWKCLPFSSPVSCVPQILNNKERGELVSDNIDLIADRIQFYIENPSTYSDVIKKAQNWSKEYTLDKFEKEIKSFLI